MTMARDLGPEFGDIAVGKGNVVHYQHYKHVPGDTCIVLVHSLAMDHDFWHLVAPVLASKVPVICVDVRGHGQSSKPKGPYSIALFAEDVKAVVQGLGYRKAIIGGASMGGCISLQFAIDHPDMTAALALIDTTSWYGPTAPEDWEKRGKKALVEGFSSMVQFQTTRWFSDQFRVDHPKLVQKCVDTFLANDVDAYHETCRAMGSFNMHEQVAAMTVPTAIVVGSEDYAAPVEMSQHMHDSIEGSTLTVIPAARHLTPLEVPEVIIDTLEGLLDRISVRQE